MSQGKNLRERAEMWGSPDYYADVVALKLFARAQLNLAAEIVARCPDIQVAVSEIRKLME